MAHVQQRFIRSLNDLQRSLERYELINDGYILPDLRVVVRLDAHRHGDWSRVPDSEYPCGPKVSQALIGTAQDIMQSGLNCVLAMIHGDEIAVYIDPRELSNPRRRARLISYFSSAASAHFLLRFGLPALFHARIAELPSADRLVEYFMWQRRCAMRNAVSHELRRVLISEGVKVEMVDAQLDRVSEEDRIRRLEESGVLVSSLTPHKRFGSMIWWQKSSPAAGVVSTSLHSRVGLPEEDEHFVEFILERLRLSTSANPKAIAASIKTEDLVSNETAPSSHRERVRFSHEKGSKRNTLIMRVPSDYKR